MNRHKAETRKFIQEIVQEHLGNVKIQLPVRRREKGRFDFIGRDIESLNARANSWLEEHGLPVSDEEREPEAAMTAAPHRSRIVHTKRAGEAGGARSRRVSLIISPRTGRVLGEQG